MKEPRNTEKCGKTKAFTLVEVTLAIGVVAVAFISVFGLLPTGLNAFHQSMQTSVCSQIAQRVINDVQQTDFSALVTGSGTTPYIYSWTLSNGAVSQVRYFDDQGDEVAPVNPAALSSAEQQKILYWVNTRIMPSTATPSTTGTSSANPNLATVTIQVANNPGNQSLYASGTLPNLWTGATLSNPTNPSAVPVTTYSTIVSRNSK